MAEPPVNQVDDDEAYESAEDEDFNPDTQPAEVESSSEEEAAPARARVKKQKRKRTRDDDDEIDADFDSGDEKIVQERQSKKQRKNKNAGDDDFSEDEGGEGGFVKTRSQRRTEQQERRPLARTDGATVDVDALWQKLSSMPIGRPPETAVPQLTENPEDYVTIKRSTKFAGVVTEEERRVLKSSAEARLYLAEQEVKKKEKDAEERENSGPGNNQNEPAFGPLRRPKKRPSRFEPNPTGEVKGLPPHLQLRWPRDKVLLPDMVGLSEAGIVAGRPLAPATKLNTVEKSMHDWASFKDKAGLTEELDEYGKSKQSYAGREGFLNKAAAFREEQRLQAKAKVA